jgi:hypothetical protein
MQALWSRAAQASSCRCSSCLHGAATIGRRTTTAASRRRFKAGDLFTACYSTILATAAVADSKVKEDRRNEWDRLIAEVKSLPIETPKGHDRIPAADKSKSDRGSSSETRKLTRPVWDGSATAAPANDAWTTHFKALDSHNPLTSPLRNTAERSQADQYAVEEEWIDVEDPEGPLLAREPKNHLQIDKVEESVAKLVDRLLLHLKANSTIQSSFLSASVRADLSAQMKEMTMRIDALQYGDARLPSYSYLDPVSIRSEQAELHESIMVLLKKGASDHSRIDIILAKICYNLLVSASPPSITTYNLLIDHFTRLERYDLGQIVVDSFLLETRYRPNSATICLLLNHFSAKGDSVGFRRIIKRMRGVDGDLRIKRRALSVLFVPEVQNWAMGNKVIHRNGHLTQKVPRNSEIFDSLIQGCLKLADVRSAVRYFRAALHEGCRVKSKVLYQIATACLEKLDYNAGRSLLSAILLQWESGSFLGHGLEYCSTSRYAIYQILGLCRVSIDSTQNLPVKASRNALQSMLHYMNIESIADSVHRFSERVSLVESLLNMTTTPEDLTREIKANDRVARLLGSKIHPDDTYQPVDLAVRILHQASLEEKHRKKKMKQNRTRARMKALQGLDNILLTQLKGVDSIQQDLLPISYNSLSPESKLKYDSSIRKSKDMPLSDIVAILLSLHREGNEENLAISELPDEKPISQSAPSPERKREYMPRPLEVPARPFYDSYPIFPHQAPVAQYQLLTESTMAREGRAV